LQTRQVFTSRDVKFHERVFPFHHFQPHSDVPLPVVTDLIPNYPTHLAPAQPSFPAPVLSLDLSTSYSSVPLDSLPNPDISVQTPPSEVYQPVRRTARTRRPPAYLHNYFCGLIHSTYLPLEHHALISLLSQYQEPKTYEEATSSPTWVEAMNKDIDALMAYNT